MKEMLWQELALPESSITSPAWELFHENSKLSQHEMVGSPSKLKIRMEQLAETLEYKGYPSRSLPPPKLRRSLSLGQAILKRVSEIPTRQAISAQHLSTLLYFGYGVNRGADNKRPRSFRVVPSAGALYPLELYVCIFSTRSFEPGVYHYNPIASNLRFLRQGDFSNLFGNMIAQPQIIAGASAVIMITAIFERSIFKYGERGYRFILLEAGHVAQNIALVSSALDLACITVGGFFDHQIDDFLGLDGIKHSAVYLAAVGKPRKQMD